MLAGDRRKNWTHPSTSRVCDAPGLSQPSPSRASRGEGRGHGLVTQLRNPGVWALLEGDGHFRAPPAAGVTSPAGEISVSLQT